MPKTGKLQQHQCRMLLQREFYGYVLLIAHCKWITLTPCFFSLNVNACKRTLAVLVPYKLPLVVFLNFSLSLCLKQEVSIFSLLEPELEGFKCKVMLNIGPCMGYTPYGWSTIRVKRKTWTFDLPLFTFANSSSQHKFREVTFDKLINRDNRALRTESWEFDLVCRPPPE